MDVLPEHAVTQRSMAWRDLRMGDVTASRFKALMGPRKGIDALTAQSYMNEVIGELLTGIPADRFASVAMKWGIEWEPVAFEKIKAFIEERDWGDDLNLPTGEYAYIHHYSEPHVGGSPDGILGDTGLLEIKCPFKPDRHIAALRDPDWLVREHRDQIQGCLWLSKREYYIAASYQPLVEQRPLVTRRVDRDEYRIAEIEDAVLKFRDQMLAAYREIIGDPF